MVCAVPSSFVKVVDSVSSRVPLHQPDEKLAPKLTKVMKDWKIEEKV